MMKKMLIVYDFVVAILLVFPCSSSVMGQAFAQNASLSLSSYAPEMESENMSKAAIESAPHEVGDDNARMHFDDFIPRSMRFHRNRPDSRNRTSLTKEEAACERQGYYGPQLEEQDSYQIVNWDRWNGQQNMDRNKKCKSATVNARGTYTSNLQACTFQFHRVDQPDIVKEVSMSSACSAKNVLNLGSDKDVVNELEDYVVAWPDECVGEYKRCYSLKRDQKILVRHMCKKNWTLPEGATHVSVDCTADKQSKIMKLEEDPGLVQQHKHHLEFYAFILILVSILLCSCFVCLICLYRYGFKPYLAVLKRSKSDSELQGLVRRRDGKLDRSSDHDDDNDQVETGNGGGSAVQQRMSLAAASRSRSRS